MKKYDSKFEKTIDDTYPELQYHPEARVSYTVPHKYEPDFVYQSTEKTFYVETKGRFRTSSEASKYKYIRDNLKDTEELIFIFQKPNTPMPNAKKRKNGTKQTQEEWSTKNKFRFFYPSNFNTKDL